MYKRFMLPMAMLTAGLCLAQAQSTYTVNIGGFPWHDRVNQWAISAIPDQYVSDKPVPQQSCTARNIVVPEGTTKATIGVLEKELPDFLGKQANATDTGDRMKIKQGAATLAYAIVTVDKPETEMKHVWMSAGLILLALEPAVAEAAAAKPAATAQPVVNTPPAAPAAGQYVPADKAEPWHDRVGRWVINKLPKEYANLPAVPQQSCEVKSLILPPGTQQVTVAISDTDVAEFQKRYPQMKDTGLKLSVEPPGGGAGLPYSIVVVPNPPEKGDFSEFARGGIVLLKVGKSEAGETPALPEQTTGVKQVLQQEQEFEGQARELPGQPAGAARKVKMFVQEPAAGINGGTGLMLVLHNWGGVYNLAEYLKWCKTFADRYNVIGISVNYLQSGQDWKAEAPYDHGYLQAMDCLRALYTVWQQLKDNNVIFNERRVYSMGGSGGGNVTQMVMKLAPHTFACGVDICGMPGLIDAIAYGTGEGTSLNAGYSKDEKSPAYLSKDMQEIRDFGNLAHCKLLKAANPSLKIVIVHGTSDTSCPVVPKIAQFQNMIAAGLEVDAHFLTPVDVDGTAITTTGHAVGDREQVVIRYADEYLKESGKLKKATAEPSDFSRGGTFEYPTSGGKYVIDYSGVPTITFVAK